MADSLSIFSRRTAIMMKGQRVWRSAIRNLWKAVNQGGCDRRLRALRDSFGFRDFTRAAEVMEERALLSAPAMGQGFSAISQPVGSSGAQVLPQRNTMVTDVGGNVY